MSTRSKRRRRNRLSPSIVAILRQGFEYEVFRDLHDHLYERFERPGVILTIRDAQDHALRACFPRKRTPLPEELFHHLTALTADSRSRSLIAIHEIAVANTLLSRARTGDSSAWGWSSSRRGLIDLYLPIRTTSGYGRIDDIAGILVFGKYRMGGAASGREIRDWVQEITTASSHSSLLHALSPAERAEYGRRLHELANSIPVLDKATREQVEYEVGRALALTQRFLSRTLTSGMLFGGEELIDKLITDQPTLGIKLSDIWSTLESNLAKIVNALPLTSAVAYVAADRDFGELRRVAAAGTSDFGPATLSWLSKTSGGLLRG